MSWLRSGIHKGYLVRHKLHEDDRAHRALERRSAPGSSQLTLPVEQDIPSYGLANNTHHISLFPALPCVTLDALPAMVHGAPSSHSNGIAAQDSILTVKLKVAGCNTNANILNTAHFLEFVQTEGKAQ